MMRFRGSVVVRGLLLASLGVAGCADAPTAPTIEVPPTREIFFTSQLMMNGSVSRSFTTLKSGEVKVIFTSMLPDTAAVVTVAVGDSDGTSCTPTTSVQVASGSTNAVITTTMGAGTHCVMVSDKGALTKTNDFSFTVTVPNGT